MDQTNLQQDFNNIRASTIPHLLLCLIIPILDSGKLGNKVHKWSDLCIEFLFLLSPLQVAHNMLDRLCSCHQIYELLRVVPHLEIKELICCTMSGSVLYISRQYPSDICTDFL